MDVEPRPKASWAAILSAWFAAGTFLLAVIGWATWREDFMLSLRQTVAEAIAPSEGDRIGAPAEGDRIGGNPKYEEIAGPSASEGTLSAEPTQAGTTIGTGNTDTTSGIGTGNVAPASRDRRRGEAGSSNPP